jgi:hypothetical protein
MRGIYSTRADVLQHHWEFTSLAFSLYLETFQSEYVVDENTVHVCRRTAQFGEQ